METTARGDNEFRLGLAALQSGDINAAERMFKAVLAAQPRHVGALNLLGTVLVRLGRFAEAETYLLRALREHASSDATLYNYGLVLKALNRPVEALERFSQALKINPSIAETWNNRGIVLAGLGRLDEAIGDFNKAAVLNPRYAEALCNKGNALVGLNHLDDALTAFQSALALKPDLGEARLGYAEVLRRLGRSRQTPTDDRLKAAPTPNPVDNLFNQAIALAAKGRHDDALANLDRIIASNPEHIQAHMFRAKLLLDLERRNDALAGIDGFLRIAPEFAEGWLGRGNILFALRRYDEALAACDRALALKPDLVEAWHGRGNVLNELKRHHEALTAYDRALALNRDFAAAWHGRGNVLSELKRSQDALAAYDRAIALVPDLAEARLGLGNILTTLNRFEEALTAFDQTLRLRSDFAEAWLARGQLFLKLKRYSEALADCDRALALNRNLAEGWAGRGTVFHELRQYDNAIAAYDEALARKPDLPYLKGDRLRAKLHLADWTRRHAEVAEIVAAVRERGLAIDPFQFLSMSWSPADQLQCARSFIADRPALPAIWRGEIYSHDRIRIAYMSADFREHATSYLMAGIFERHDRSRFETTAISLRTDHGSAMRRRIEDAFDRFVDVQDKSDTEVADLICRDEIDIVIDLMGFVAGNRLGVVAQRPAPVQVNYLGYPGTMGAGYMDYIIGDRTIIPEEDFPFYSEQVVWLPDSYYPTDAGLRIAEHRPSRRDCGLPEAGFVFCCFNNTYKITPEIFDVWMRLLAAKDGSVLWLMETSATARANLCREAERRGLAAERLIFAPRLPVAGHLARCGQADLVLDTLPYNAHTTATDALWAGVPVVTCTGSTFVARVATSLLKAVGLDELVTGSLRDYEALALRLAEDRPYLASLKNKLARNRETYPLFNTERFTRYLEAAYTTMWERNRRGQKPQAFAVDRID